MQEKCLACSSFAIKEYKHLLVCKKCGFYVSKIKKSRGDIQSYYDANFERQQIVDKAKLNIYYKIIKFLIHRLGNKDIKVLEVGFGSGMLLKCLKQLGYEVYGVELSERATQTLKNLIGKDNNIYLGSFEGVDLPEKFFDVVVLLDVLYEMEDMDFIFEKLNRILKDGGLLVIRVKNATVHIMLDRFSSIFNLFMNAPFVYHNFGFTFKSLKLILSKAGFKILGNKAYLYLTLGDPYCQLRLSSSFVVWLKYIYFFVAEVFYYFTKIIITPSFLIFAYKSQKG
ncbi:MAG: class I SAM-dependent methyltransferase [Endomicrobia bacterium]|nr:class I SAM-dependent methyltransferase [Endomicrobiia bacterium]MDW8055322.1 methyltransferase domain-containing protein [Elusimicrobiota bacterium]